jgi:hypothetical protein
MYIYDIYTHTHTQVVGVVREPEPVIVMREESRAN